jgi:hypothetical protein
MCKLAGLHSLRPPGKRTQDREPRVHDNKRDRAWTRLGAFSRAIQVTSGLALLGVAVYYLDVFRQLL